METSAAGSTASNPRRCLTTTALAARGFAIDAELSIHAHAAGLRVAELPVEYRPRPAGSKSKLATVADGCRILRHILGLYRQVSYPSLTPQPESRSARRLPLLVAAGLLACIAVACAESPTDYRVESDLGESIRSLGSDDLEESEPAADRMVAYGRNAIPALATALEHETPAVRLGVVDVLGRIDHPDALPVLMRAAASDADVEVRATAIR